MTARQVLSNALMKEDLDVISFSILFHFSLGCGTKVGWILQSTKVITDLPFPSVPEDQRTWVRQGGTDSWTSDRPGPQGKPCLRGLEPLARKSRFPRTVHLSWLTGMITGTLHGSALGHGVLLAHLEGRSQDWGEREAEASWVALCNARGRMWTPGVLFSWDTLPGPSDYFPPARRKKQVK